MIAKAIDKILSLSGPRTATVGYDTYSDMKLIRMDKELRAEPIMVRNLSSLLTYICSFQEDRKKLPLLVHVIDEKTVELVTALDKDRKRECLMVAKVETPAIPFGQFIENEKMVISLQSSYVNDPETDIAAVLKFAGSVSAGSIREYGDDGVTQKATVRQGVASKAEAIVPSPCTLRPYRTFPEVEQPSSRFIFRMREGRGETVESALFEADGGAWKNEAMKNISIYLRAFLEKQDLKGQEVIVIS